MKSWRRTARRLLGPRLASVWAALVLTCSLLLLAPYTLTDRTMIRAPPPQVRPPCRQDMAVNMLPPMPENESELVLQLFRYLSRPHPRTCHKVARMGCGVTRGVRFRTTMDGHKFICMDAEQVDLPKTDHCLVYSIGINGEWSFDDDMDDFNCQVYAFDPSMNVSSHNRSALVHFFPVGVRGRDGINPLDWPLLTLDSLAAGLGHSDRTIHYLKMDVEGAEWEVLRQQAERGRSSTLARVQQLAVELHFAMYLPPERHTAFYRDVYRSMLALQQLGFYLFAFEENQVLLDWVQIPGLGRNLTSAMEVVWLRSDCARQAADL